MLSLASGARASFPAADEGRYLDLSARLGSITGGDLLAARAIRSGSRWAANHCSNHGGRGPNWPGHPISNYTAPQFLVKKGKEGQLRPKAVVFKYVHLVFIFFYKKVIALLSLRRYLTFVYVFFYCEMDCIGVC